MKTETVYGNPLLYAGLENILNQDRFDEAKSKVCSDAYDTIFAAQDNGELQWLRDGADFDEFVTQAVVNNVRGELVTVPIILFTTVSGDACRGVYLMLGSRQHSPCLNDNDKRVLRLYEQVTGKTWSSRLE